MWSSLQTFIRTIQLNFHLAFVYFCCFFPFSTLYRFFLTFFPLFDAFNSDENAILVENPFEFRRYFNLFTVVDNIFHSTKYWHIHSAFPAYNDDIHYFTQKLRNCVNSNVHCIHPNKQNKSHSLILCFSVWWMHCIHIWILENVCAKITKIVPV